MKSILLMATFICIGVTEVAAQIDYCSIYNTALDSAYNKAFGFFIDSLNQRSDLIDPMSPPLERKLENKKWVIHDHFLFIKKTTVDFEEDFIKDWFLHPVKGDKGLKHVSGSLVDRCKLNNRLHYEVWKTEKPIGIDFEGTKDIGEGERLDVVWVSTSDLIFFNHGKELIMWLTFYNRRVFNNISGERTFGIKMKCVKGRWVIKECKANAGG